MAPLRMLDLEDITVSFDGFRALNALNLHLEAGELRCIIGPNGAGKTTLMDVITGKIRPDRGSACFSQHVDLLRMTEPEIAQAGIGRKFQQPTVFDNQMVYSNLELAMSGAKTVWKWLNVRITSRQRERIDEVLDKIGLREHRFARAGTLSHGQKQWLEIGMLLMQDPQLLLIDEPVAGMTPQEIERTAELLVSLAGKHTLMVVEHDMAFVRAIGGRVTVLHEGAVLAHGDMNSIQANPLVKRVYLGE